MSADMKPFRFQKDPRFIEPIINYTPTTSFIPPPIYCQSGHPDKTLSDFACLSCEKYLCRACDARIHILDKRSHYRFQTKNLKSYIAFNESKPSNCSHTRRALLSPNNYTMIAFHGCFTLYETFQRAVKVYGNKNAVGRRGVDALTAKIGTYEWLTFKELGQRVYNFASGLYSLGLEQKAKIGLYSVNRIEWLVGEYASFCHSYITVPLYDTLGSDAAELVINQAGISVVVASRDKLPSLIQIAKKLPALKAIVLMPLQPFDPKPKTPLNISSLDIPSTLKIFEMEELEKIGAHKPAPHTPPAPHDLCTFCYTSGTTGTPKGAMLSHSNVVSNFTSLMVQGGAAPIALQPSDVHVSFLPLAHMFERLAHGMILSNGASIGYSRGNPLLLLEDIEAVRPTIFVGVPRLYNRLYDKIIATVDGSTAIKRWLFYTAYKAKLANLQENNSVASFLWDRVIFRHIAARLGGRVRLFITGSAPISDSVMQFLRVAFSSIVLEGYGQTESTAGISLTNPLDQNTVGNVGTPFSCNEIRLEDVPEMKYTSADVINGVPHPRGEICIRGSNRFLGYYKDQEKTNEAIDKDGWLHTGDIGVWTSEGTLRIIDRKKNIFKLSQGEYIAPEKIENVYLRSKYIAQIFVYGSSLESQLVAIVIPDIDTLTAWAKNNQIDHANDFSLLCANPAVTSMLQQEIDSIGPQGKLAGFEQVKAIFVTHDLFSVENGMLTPTMKLKRNEAAKKYETQIKAMYQKLNTATGPIKSKL